MTTRRFDNCQAFKNTPKQQLGNRTRRSAQLLQAAIPLVPATNAVRSTRSISTNRARASLSTYPRRTPARSTTATSSTSPSLANWLSTRAAMATAYSIAAFAFAIDSSATPGLTPRRHSDIRGESRGIHIPITRPSRVDAATPENTGQLGDNDTTDEGTALSPSW